MANEDVPYDPDVQAENIPLYIFMIMYLLALVGVGVLASKWKAQASKAGGEVSAHFSGDFNPVLLILTTFSSVFSGYTVVGVPTESRGRGFYAIRWISAILAIAISMAVFFPRLRRLGIVRGYHSPNDFLADRYRSKGLTVLGNLCTCLPQLFYLTVQLVSFAGLLNGLTGGAIPNNWAMLLFAVLVLVLEKIGGMGGVVLKDAIGATLMVFGFITIFIVVNWKYGTLAYLAAENCESLGWVNQTAKDLLEQARDYESEPPTCLSSVGPTDPACVEFGCLPSNEFVGLGKPSYFWFLFNFLAFPLNPHMVQRATISKSDDAVKITIQVVCWAAFLTMIPGIVMGVTVATFSDSWQLSSSSADAFAAMSNELKSGNNPFLYGLVSMLACAALAAIMSTADSVILGVSNAVSIDIYKGVLNPQATSEDVVKFGSGVSLTFTFISLLAGFFVTSAGFGTLLTLQNGIILQIIPSFLCGLFFEGVKAKALQVGLYTGLVCFPLFMFVLPVVPWVPPENMCALINYAVAAMFQFMLPEDTLASYDRDEFQQSVRGRFQEPLTAAKIQECMNLDVEPSGKFISLAFGVFLASVPFFWDIETTELVQWLGWPAWSAYVMVLSIATAVLLTVALRMWKPGPLPAMQEAKAPDLMQMKIMSRSNVSLL